MENFRFSKSTFSITMNQLQVRAKKKTVQCFSYCSWSLFDYSIFESIAVLLNVSTTGFMVPTMFSQTLYNATYQKQSNADVYGVCQKISWRGRCCVGGSLVAVVVVVLLVVEAAVLEGLVPFLVPVTNSI